MPHLIPEVTILRIQLALAIGELTHAQISEKCGVSLRKVAYVAGGVLHENARAKYKAGNRLIEVLAFNARGLTTAEIATKTGRTYQAVYRLLSRAKARGYVVRDNNTDEKQK